MIGIEPKDIDSLYSIIESTTLPANLFVKHLMVLSDMGGESFRRISREFKMLFPHGELKYTWRGDNYTYNFKALPDNHLNNITLRVDGKRLPIPSPLSDRHKDAIAIMMFGSIYSDEGEETSSILLKGEIGDYLGKPDKLKPFAEQRYIWVSRQTGGEKSNRMGQIAQAYVAQYLRKNLEHNGISVQTSGRLPGVSHTDPKTGRLTSFDMIASNGEKFIAVEVAFQVTTNSVIERKAGQAQNRYTQINAAGHKIAYVIDGSGYFERDAALRVICNHSHCTVAYSDKELDLLIEFLRKEFGL